MAKIFTKKIALIALTVVLAVSGVIWAVVSNFETKFKSNIISIPSAIYVSGNGTASVMVDDYLYFVGDSIATSEIKYGDNEYFANEKIQDSGIYRVKIENSKPVLDYVYDNTIEDEGEEIELNPGDEGYNTKVVGVNDWDSIGEKDNGIEAVVPKIAGHDQSAMWVFGNNLIYVTPHNRYDKRGILLSNYLDFFRVDLDGKDHTLIYTTETADLTTENFTVWADSTDEICLLVHETENKEIVKVNVQNKQVTVLADEVVDVVFPKATQYCRDKVNENLDKVYGGVMGYVYYTKTHTDTNKKGNLLYRRAIKSGESELIAEQNGDDEIATFKPLSVTPLQNGNAQFVFSVIVNNDNNAETKPYALCLMTNDNMSEYTYEQPKVEDCWGIDKEDDIKIYANGFCTIDKELYHYDINGTVMNFNRTVLSSAVDKVLAVFDNTVYVQSGTTVNKVQLGQLPVSVNVAPATDTNEEEETTEENPFTLPLAILSQPHGSTGNPMIFAQDLNHIRLYAEDGSVSYLRFKQI